MRCVFYDSHRQDATQITELIVIQTNDVFPLRDSIFEDRPVKIPYNYAWLLEEEYGRAALVRTKHQGSVAGSPGLRGTR